MRNRNQRLLARLRRALSTSTNDLDREQYAFAIAALGTPEAYRALVSELEQKTRAKEACAAALRDVGSPATPLLLHAIQRDPDNRYLPYALSSPFDDEVVDALVAACELTVDEWVVLVTTQHLAKWAPGHVPKLGEVVGRRQSSLLTSAMHCALVAGRDGGDASALERYLAVASPVAAQDLALAFAAVRRLPAAQDLLRRRIAKGRVGDRAHALRLVGGDGFGDFADLVLDVWLHDKSPTVRFAARDAIQGLEDALYPALQKRLTLTCEVLWTGIVGFVSPLRPGDAAMTSATKDHLAAVEETVRQLEELRSAAFWCDSMTPDSAEELLGAYRTSIPQLIGVGATLDGQLQEALLRLGERLIRNQLGLLRYAWISGEAAARRPTLEVLGLPVAALSPIAPHLPGAPRQRLSRDEFLSELSRCASAVLSGWWRLNWGFPEGVEAAQWPMGSLTYLRQRIADIITGSEIGGQEMLPVLISALQQSRQAEREARRQAETELGPVVLADIQREFDEQPLLLLSREKKALADFVRSHEQPRGEIPAHLLTAGPMLAEQVFQTMVLNVVAAYLSPRAVATLIECTDSNSALVVECAQTLLVRVGTKALTRLHMAVPRCRDDRQRAHLLEVCRCIDASSTLALAREYVASDDSLVASSCLHVLEKAGTIADVSTVKLTLTRRDELVVVSALVALGRLGPDQSVDEFTVALSHPSAAVRHAALSGLRRCCDDVQRATGELLSQSEDAFRRTYGQALASPDLSRALCPRFKGEPVAVAGSFVLGARCAVSGPLPWQWGLGDLFAQDEEFDWTAVWPLIAHDEELAREWIEYSLHRGLPPRLLTRLAALAVRPERGAEAEQAKRLLLALARDTLEPILRVAALYYRCPYDTVLAAAPAAFDLALHASSQDAVRDLTMPNPSANNPLGDGGLPEFVNESLAFGIVFSMHLRVALPKALSVHRTPELDSKDSAVRTTAVEEQWRHLMTCQDFLHGFWVEPLLTPDDLIWYCGIAGGEAQLRHEMIGYLVAAIALLPHFHATREKHEQALHRIFRPLLRKTFARLARLHQAGAGRDGLEALVEEVFWTVVEEYDALKYWPTAAYLPLGTLSDLGDAKEGYGARAPSAAAERPYVPFPLFLQRRMEELVRMEKAKARRVQEQGAMVSGDLLEAFAAVDATEQWRRQEAELIEAMDQDAQGGPPLELLLRQNEATTEWLRTKSVDLLVDGENVECVDIVTLAQLLDKSVDALRKLHSRERLDFIIQSGIRYLPVDRIREARALLTTDGQIAAIRGVHRNTVAAWRRQAPPGMGTVELVQHLLTRERQR